ncbi:hypothetical protein vseg_018887 [Gypsophila vaccaria]
MQVKSSKTMESVVGELEGALVKELDSFPYLLLVAFEASGPIRFAFLLLACPIVRFLGLLGLGNAGFKLSIFIAVFGVRISEIEYVGRAVLPKFYLDHIDMDAWRVFNRYGNRVVISKSPRVMVEWFAKEHLGADQVIGSELVVNRFGRATGFVRDVGSEIESCHVQKVFGGKEPCLGLGRPTSDICFGSTSFMSLCEKQCYPPYSSTHLTEDQQQEQQHDRLNHPKPVVFHDGRLAIFPTPSMAVLILMWFPIGVIIAIIRLIITLILPVFVLSHENLTYGIHLSVKGNPPKPVCTSDSTTGVLFVMNHRVFMDAVVVSVALGRTISAVTYSLPRLTEICSPIPSVRLTRNRSVDAKKIEEQLKKGDLGICAEGTTCREPFLLRFSGLFAELTDQIVPVAVNYRPTFFHPSKARGWKGLDLIFFAMNPICFYEVTFLNQLPVTATCSSGKDSYDVANDVQQRLASVLGFTCTNFTRKDKYIFLKGDDGRVK